MAGTESSVYLAVVKRRIVQRRIELRLTQEDAAGRCGLSVRGYQALEGASSKWRFNPGLLQLWNIAHGLQLEMEQLIGTVSAEESVASLEKPPKVNRVNLKSRVDPS